MNALILFAKRPREGEVKTRIGHAIGMGGAKDLYVAFLKDLFQEHAEQEYALIPFVNSYEFPIAELTKEYLEIHKQEGSSLGEKMHNTFKKMAHNHEKMIIIGSDMPHLSKERVEQAFKQLDDVDVVLGPAEDGGYYLVGMKQPHNIFENIEWSSATVLGETIKQLEDGRLSYSLLEKDFDVDTIEEIPKLKRHDHPLSNTRSVLNKLRV